MSSPPNGLIPTRAATSSLIILVDGQSQFLARSSGQERCNSSAAGIGSSFCSPSSHRHARGQVNFHRIAKHQEAVADLPGLRLRDRRLQLKSARSWSPVSRSCLARSPLTSIKSSASRAIPRHLNQRAAQPVCRQKGEAALRLLRTADQTLMLLATKSVVSNVW
jgi:hypothetical protein